MTQEFEALTRRDRCFVGAAHVLMALCLMPGCRSDVSTACTDGAECIEGAQCVNGTCITADAEVQPADAASEVDVGAGECAPGDRRHCGFEVGVCREGEQACGEDGLWGVCDGLAAQGEEQCDGLDNDCDDRIDEALTAPVAARVDGACVGLRQICSGVEGWVEPDLDAIPDFEPEELSCDGLDNDCNGIVDDDFDLSADAQNCGACGRECDEVLPGTDACIDGTCRVGCRCSHTCAGRTVCHPQGYCAEMDETYLKAPNVDVGDRFGAVALFNNWLAVGAENESGNAASTLGEPNNNASEAGVVYIYQRLARGDWVPVDYLKGHNTRAGDAFGKAVALHERTLAISAVLHDGPEFLAGPDGESRNFGAVYVFELDDAGQWSQTDYLTANPSSPDDIFGVDVSVHGDILAVGTWSEDGDANSTVEAPNDNAPDSGAIYVFERGARGDPEGRWRQTAYVKAPNADPGDWFGRAVDVFDGAGDDNDRIIVGAAYESGDAMSRLDEQNNDMPRAGAAYIVERVDNTWEVSHYLKAVNAEEDDRFGHDVAIHGATVVVGAYAESGDENSTPEESNNNSPGAGAGYVYDLIGEHWQRTAFLKAIGTPQGANFGSGIVLAERHLVVGATFERTSGAAYLFTCGEDRRWSHRTLLKPQNSDNGDRWGDIDAMHGGVIALGSTYEDGDATSTLAAPNNRADRAGAVTVFELW